MRFDDNLEDIQKNLKEIDYPLLRQIEDLIEPIPVYYSFDLRKKYLEFKAELEKTEWTVNLHKSYKDLAEEEEYGKDFSSF